MNANVLAILSIALLALIVRKWLRGKSLDGKEMPGPPGILFFGHLLQIMRPDFHRILSAWSEKYGGVYRISILGLQGVVVSEPRVIAEILGRDRALPEVPKHLASYSQLNLLWGGLQQHSIFTGHSTDRWRLVRKAVSPCFSSASIRDKFDTVLDRCCALRRTMEAMEPQKTMDMDDAGMRLTLDIVAQAAFGYETHAVDFSDNRIIDSLPCALKELQKRMTNPLQAFVHNEASRRAMHCAGDFKEACLDILNSMRSRGPPSASDCSVGAQLLRIADPTTGIPLTDAELLAEIGTFIMGGFETTAHTLSFTLFCIVSHAEVQSTIAAELHALGLLSVAGQTAAREVQHGDLHQLKYLDCTLKEAMRMFPVVAGFPRLTDRDLRIGNYRVSKGTFVYVLFHSLHNSPQYWNDPATFRPERWQERGAEYAQATVGVSTDICQQDIDSGSSNQIKRFLPFSDGPRSCVAQAMALMELKTALAVLCSRFYFQPASSMGGMEGLRALEKMSLTLHVRGGIHLHCQPHQAHFDRRFWLKPVRSPSLQALITIMLNSNRSHEACGAIM